jgi:predicted  nucleic acid-binding Zn-ribbon protein
VDFDLDRGRPLAIFEVAPAGKVEARKVVIEEGLSSSAAFEGLTEDRLERLAKATSLTDAERGAMKVGLERLQEQHAAQAEVERLRGEITVIEADIERLRGHLQAMAGEGDGDGGKKNPVVERLLATEDQLQARRKELDTASKALDLRTAATREGFRVLAPAR